MKVVGSRVASLMRGCSAVAIGALLVMAAVSRNGVTVGGDDTGAIARSIYEIADTGLEKHDSNLPTKNFL